MKPEKLQTLREKSIQANESFVVAKHEYTPVVSPLVTDASRFKNNGITNDDESKEASQLCAKITKEVKNLGEHRLDATRILDTVKKDLIEVEKEITLEAVEMVRDITILNNKYLSDKAEKIRLAKERIERENSQRIEREMLPSRIKNCLISALECELSSINQKMEQSWARLTIENFEERIVILKSFIAKVNYDTVLSYLTSLPVNHITEDEFNQIIKDNINYEKFSTDFNSGFNVIKSKFINDIDNKRNQLKTQSDQERAALEEKVQNDLINKKAQEIADKNKRDEALRVLEENKILQSDLEVQAKKNSFEDVKGRDSWSVTVDGQDTDWNAIITMYSEQFGLEKLEFLFTFLVKQNRPIIKGVTYTVSKKIINKL